ncbi:MAG: DedA family protein [Alphaproteobacteria bacterium]|nr:DedA family protein [Alphaproteobacteria bacterium]
MMKRLYEWVMRMVSGPKALMALCAVSFVESSFFPIPPDLLLIPMILKQREKAFRLAFYCTVFSVLGGAFGYAIGHFLYDVVGVPILDFYNYRESFEQFCQNYNTYGAWIVFGAGVTPFPYKIITIASGVTGLNFAVFMMASSLARGLRFYLIAWLLWKWGKPMKEFIERNLGWLSVVFFVLLIGSFYLIKYL